MRKKIGEYSYDEVRSLGKGTFGSVYLGHHNKTLAEVAVKVVSLEPFDGIKKKRLLDNFRNQVTNMQLAEGKNIVQLLAVQVSERNLYLVCEYCSGGSLDRHIKKERRLREKDAMRIFSDIVKGFKCLHDNNIVHRDLKPANILLHNGVAKVGDFGFSKLIEDHDQLLLSLVGTPHYMSPQILSNRRYTEKTDIWSLGIILYEMLFGRVPFDSSTKDIDYLAKCIYTSSRVIIPDNPKVSKATANLLQRMLQVEEADRIGWEELFAIEAQREQIEETLSTEVKSQSQSNKDSQVEKILNYAKSYFQSNRVVLDVTDLRNRSTSNDLIKTIITNGQGSTRIQTEEVCQIQSDKHAGSVEAVEKVLNQRNHAVLLISIYLKLASLIESSLIEISIEDFCLQLLLLKQAFISFFEIYRHFKQSRQLSHSKIESGEDGVSWELIFASEYRNNLQTLASIDNTMCSVIFSSFLKKFQESVNTMAEDEEGGLSEIVLLANKDFDRTPKTQHLMRKYMWQVLLKHSYEQNTHTLKLCSLMGSYLKRLEQLSTHPSFSLELVRLYDLVETSEPDVLQKLVRESANNLD